MKISIYIKFIIIYIAAAIVSFIFVTLGTSGMIMNHMTAEKAETLYLEASLLSTDYAEDYYRSKTAASLETVHSHFNAIATYLDADIWMIDIDGKVILQSGKALAPADSHVIEHFDPSAFGTSYYVTGTFFDQFDEEVLSVISPVNASFGTTILPVNVDAIDTAMVIPADGPSLGTAPSGTCMCRL